MKQKLFLIVLCGNFVCCSMVLSFASITQSRWEMSGIRIWIFFILVHAVVLCYIGYKRSITLKKRLRWSRGSVLAFGTQVRGFKPGRCRWIFQGEKIIITPSFGREVKPFVPCRIFAACKRTRKCMRGSRSFRSKLPAISRPSSFSFHY